MVKQSLSFAISLSHATLDSFKLSAVFKILWPANKSRLCTRVLHITVHVAGFYKDTLQFTIILESIFFISISASFSKIIALKILKLQNWL